MKFSKNILILISVLIIHFVPTISHGRNLGEYDDIYIKCKLKTRAQHGDFQSSGSPTRFIFTNQKDWVDCLVQCILEDTGLYSGREFDFDAVQAQVGGIPEVTRKTIDKCREETKCHLGFHSCRYAYLTAACWFRERSTDACDPKLTAAKVYPC